MRKFHFSIDKHVIKRYSFAILRAAAERKTKMGNVGNVTLIMCCRRMCMKTEMFMPMNTRAQISDVFSASLKIRRSHK